MKKRLLIILALAFLGMEIRPLIDWFSLTGTEHVILIDANELENEKGDEDSKEEFEDDQKMLKEYQLFTLHLLGNDSVMSHKHKRLQSVHFLSVPVPPPEFC